VSYTICQIIGVGYSGSSILNLVLDSLEGVRGLGEANRIYHNNIICPCCLCMTSYDETKKCTFYDDISLDLFYSGCFSKYSDANVLIDSSKIGSNYPRKERWFKYKSVYMLKWPHEFIAGSGFKPTHWNSCANTSLQERFDLWMRTNESELDFSKPSLVVPYRSFASQPDLVLKSICDYLNIPFSKQRQDWWNTTTHILGGNWSARAQMNDFFKTAYLDQVEKYKSHFHEIFLDDAWRQDRDLCQESIELYKTNQKRCDAILSALKMPLTEFMIDDIEGNNADYTPCVSLE